MTNPPGVDFGLNENITIETESANQMQNDEAIENVDPSSHRQQKKKKKSISAGNDLIKKRFELLKKQTELQEKIYNSSVENNKYLRKIYELKKEKNTLLKEITRMKKEKLELYKAELKEKQANRLDKLKIKEQILELQREQMEIQQTMQ